MDEDIDEPLVDTGLGDPGSCHRQVCVYLVRCGYHKLEYLPANHSLHPFPSDEVDMSGSQRRTELGPHHKQVLRRR